MTLVDLSQSSSLLLNKERKYMCSIRVLVHIKCVWPISNDGWKGTSIQRGVLSKGKLYVLSRVEVFPFYYWVMNCLSCCLLLIDKVRTKDKTYIWLSSWWKTTTWSWGIYMPLTLWQFNRVISTLRKQMLFRQKMAKCTRKWAGTMQKRFLEQTEHMAPTIPQNVKPMFRDRYCPTHY